MSTDKVKLCPPKIHCVRPRRGNMPAFVTSRTYSRCQLNIAANYWRQRESVGSHEVVSHIELRNGIPYHLFLLISTLVHLQMQSSTASVPSCTLRASTEYVNLQYSRLGVKPVGMYPTLQLRYYTI
jgi:hypothetical protein